jgi:integrase
MAPRQKARRPSVLPMNLYQNHAGKTYRYKHPLTGKFHGMGNDKAKAVAAAKQLNRMLMPDNELVNAVLGSVTVNEHIEWMRHHIIPDREYSQNTLSLTQTRYRNLITAFGNKSLADVTVQQVSELIENTTPRVANQIRQVAIDVFNVAMSRGLCDRNPAQSTLKRKQKTQRKRLTEKEFIAIHNQAPKWLQKAMDMAYLTLQRRSDIVALKFSDITDGHLYVIQQKTQKYDTGYLKIKLSLPLLELIESCQDKTNSPFIIHRKPNRIVKRENLEHWTQIMPATVSREFKKVRDDLTIFKKVPMGERPTFHEIRALGIKAMKDIGENPQQLAGHSSEGMTRNYDSGHDEVRWVETGSSLKLLG